MDVRIDVHPFARRLQQVRRAARALVYFDVEVERRPVAVLGEPLDVGVARNVVACVEIKILRRVRAEPSRRPPRHRRDACSMAWRCRFVTARRSRHGRVIAEK